MFGFFGADKKQGSPAPQPQNTPQQPQRIIEKGSVEIEGGPTPYTRGKHICETFGTTDLDMVLERYAPEHSDIIKSIPENQQKIRENQGVLGDDHQKIYDKLKEQEKKIEEQGRLLKEQGEAITAMQEQLKMQAKWTEMLNGKLDSVLTAVEKLSQK